MGQDPILPRETMIHDILDLMTCPSCDGDVYINTSPREERELVDETMSCLRCGACIPVKGGVPRFAGRLTDQQQIAESFGLQWRYREEGRFEQSTLYGLSAEQEVDACFQALGITSADLAGKTFLDAGCGDGFLLRLLSQYPARFVGIDIHSSILRTYEACRPFPNITIVEADILRPPLRHLSFDFVWSEGVIVHTPDPKGAFKSLSGLVKPGGKLYVWVYPSQPLSIYQRVRDLLVAPYLLPRPALLFLTYLLALPIFLAAKPYAAWKRRRGSAAVPKSSVRTVAFGLYDNLSPRYQTRHTVDEVAGWFKEFGFSQLIQTGLIGFSGTKTS